MAEVAQHADPIHLRHHIVAEVGKATVVALAAAGSDEVLRVIGHLRDTDAQFLE
jgi:hypothetical protein